MNDKQRGFALAAVVALQIAVLLGEYLGAVYPLWYGQEIALKTRPIDPRSLFRGNYALLNYDISTIPGAALNSERQPRNGENVYVQLQAAADGTYQYAGASYSAPATGTFIRGRIRANRRSSSETYQVEYGIEAFYAPKEQAQALERQLRHTAIAKVMLAANGKAALQNVVAAR